MIFSCNKNYTDNNLGTLNEKMISNLFSFFKNEEYFIEYKEYNNLENNDVFFEVSSRNIFPALMGFEGLEKYKKEVDSLFHISDFKKIKREYQVSFYNKKSFFRESSNSNCHIYITKVNKNEYYCELMYDNGSIVERKEFVEYRGLSLRYYIVFSDEYEIERCFKSKVNYD